MDEIIGATFPIPKWFMDRFFEDKKTVFIKPTNMFTNLRKGTIFIFYQSREDTGFIGQAVINNIIFSDDPFSFFDIYGDSIFITREELSEYVQTNSIRWKSFSNHKKPKKWLAIELTNIKRYESIIKPRNPINVSGRYIKKDEDIGN